MPNPIYASGNFKAAWNGVKLNTGWGDDQFLTVTPNGALKEVAIGADGFMSISKLADQGGTITMTFKQTAEVLKDIDKIAAGEQLVGEFYELPYTGAFTFEDPSGNVDNFYAHNAVLIDRGTHEHQKVMGERTITWACERLIYGTPADIIPVINQYIKD